MIDQLIKEFEGYRKAERDEDLYLLKLRTKAEGVGSIQYGDDTSHGTVTGDKMERAAIQLAEAEKVIDKKRTPRFEVAAETLDWFHDHLEPEPARIMEFYAIDGMSYREISYKTGKSVGWISKVVQKSRAILKSTCER